MAIASQRTGLGIRRHFTTPAVHPYDEVVWERRDARITNYRDGNVAFEQLGVEVPASWSMNATNILSQKYFRGTLGTPEREWSLKQVADRVVDTITAWGMKDGYFEDDAEAADLQRRAEAPDHPPEGRVQLAGLVQHRGQGCSPAGIGVLHPRRRGLDGLDPELVHRRRGHLQRRLGRRGQPEQDPRLGGDPRRGRDSVGSGQLHARCRLVGRDHQVGRQDPPGREDGDPRRRPPRHLRLRVVQGDRGAQSQGAPRLPVSTWTSTGWTRSRSSTRTRTTRCVSPTSSCRPSSTTPTGLSRTHDGRAGERRPGARPVPTDRTRFVGVRRSRNAVRHDDQCVAHGAERGPHQRKQPVQRVHAHRQLGVQPRFDKPASVPR